MTCKTNIHGIVCLDDREQRQPENEQMCMHCDGAGIVSNKVCKECAGYGVIVLSKFDVRSHSYSPNREQWEAMQKLGGVA